MFKGERYEKSGESLTRRGKIVDEPGGVGGAVKSRGNISKNACKWGKDVGEGVVRELRVDMCTLLYLK